MMGETRGYFNIFYARERKGTLLLLHDGDKRDKQPFIFIPSGLNLLSRANIKVKLKICNILPLMRKQNRKSVDNNAVY